MLEDFRLKTFLAVASCGSFTQAAKTLGISQPAVSQSIGSLEKELGLTLFDRKRGEVQLTSAGLAFRDYAQQIVYWYDAAASMFAPGGRLTGGRPIRIAADAVSASYILPPALAVLHAAHPDISFDVVPLTGTEEGSLLSDKVPDAELSVCPSPETMDFEGESKLVGVMEAAVISSTGNRSVAGAAVSQEDTPDSSKPFSTIAGIHVSNRFALWSGYVPFMTQDLVPRVAVCSPSIETLKSMVLDSTDLVGIVPRCAVRRELASGSLLLMPVSLPEFVYDIHLNPLPGFAGKRVYQTLVSALTDSLKRVSASVTAR